MAIKFNIILFVLTLVTFNIEVTMASPSAGITKYKSINTVKKTINKLQKILEQKGMTIFTRIDHSAGAKKVSKSLRPTELLVFGNPKLGTILMQCEQALAIDLPMKMIAWKDSSGQVWLGYNNPDFIGKRHQLGSCGKAIITKMSKALKGFANQATH